MTRHGTGSVQKVQALSLTALATAGGKALHDGSNGQAAPHKGGVGPRGPQPLSCLGRDSGWGCFLMSGGPRACASWDAGACYIEEVIRLHFLTSSMVGEMKALRGGCGEDTNAWLRIREGPSLSGVRFALVSGPQVGSSCTLATNTHTYTHMCTLPAGIQSFNHQCISGKCRF